MFLVACLPQTHDAETLPAQKESGESSHLLANKELPTERTASAMKVFHQACHVLHIICLAIGEKHVHSVIGPVKQLAHYLPSQNSYKLLGYSKYVV